MINSDFLNALNLREYGKKALVCIGAAVALCSCGPRQHLPDPQPALQPAAAKRQAVTLKVIDVMARSNRIPEIRKVEAPSLCSGNKAVGFRSRLFDSDEACEIFVDGKQVGIGKASGGEIALRFDKVAGTITSTGADRSYTLRPLGDGRVAFDWEASKGGFSFCFYLSGAYYRRAGVACDGAAIQLLPLDALSSSPKLLKALKGPARIEVAPGKPLEAIAVETGTGCAVSLSESKGQLWIAISSPESKGSFTLDLGASAVTDVAAPPAIAGVDFWASDRIHVPAPTTRNLMPNPSFEQGLRYWKWYGGGGKYVPSETPAYSIADDAKFGARSLFIQPAGGSFPIISSYIPVDKGRDYTISFYAKAAKPGASLVLGLTFKDSHVLSTEWKRYSLTVKPDKPVLSLLLCAASCPIWVDGIQVEEAATPTDYVGPEVEGRLLTADPDGMLALGQKPDARFQLSGKPGLKGELELSIRDFYREEQFRKKYHFALGPDGLATLPLPLDAKALGTGVFVLRADYRLEGKAVFSDYYRFSIMNFLENKHATKNLFGNNLGGMRKPRSGDEARNYMRWGWGATSYCFDERLEQQYRISSFTETIYAFLTPEERPDYCAALGWWGPMGGKPANASAWTEFTPERVQRIEDICYAVVKRNPKVPVWAPSCEVEGQTPLIRAGNFDEWAKFQAAAFRGIKRANPKAVAMPDTGTSGLNRLRGFHEQEGYMRSTQGLAKWDALGAHPYGTVDGTRGLDDFDATNAQFIEMMAKYGYADTPIYYTEGSPCGPYFIPEWGTGRDGSEYWGVSPTYDSGWEEYIHASLVARLYLICLKYWPKVQTFTLWFSNPYLDMDFAPYFTCMVPNTLGHLLPNPRYKADFRPVGGIRGYAFEDGMGNGLVAVWCVLDKVDNGLDRGPEMLVKFDGGVPEFIDLMGKVRQPLTKGGVTSVQLTSAPLFLRCPAAGLDKLLKDLNAAQIVGAGSALKVDVQPTAAGQVEAVLANQTTAALSGKLVVGGETRPFEIPPKSKVAVPVPGGTGAAPGKLDTWRKSLAVEFANGKREEMIWDLTYFYVPRTAS
ncbi:MAG: carbohydrate binding domain-containing protein, partial [Verrucomicrobiae bacterium]